MELFRPSEKACTLDPCSGRMQEMRVHRRSVFPSPTTPKKRQKQQKTEAANARCFGLFQLISRCQYRLTRNGPLRPAASFPSCSCPYDQALSAAHVGRM